MKQKTVRLLGGHYRLTDNGVVEEVCFIYSDYNTFEAPKIEYRKTEYQIDAVAMLVSKTDVSPNALRSGEDKSNYFLVFDEDGIGGNTNHDIKRYHGWRGTTCDKSVYAHGLRKITAIRELKSGDIAVTVGHDLKPDED